MRRVILAAASTVTGLVMLLSFKTRGAPATTHLASGPTGTTETTPATTPGTTPATTPGATPAATPTSVAAAGPTTVTGSAVDTRYGPVEVQVTVANGQLTAVNAIEYPSDRPRDVQINDYAIPELNQEALAAKSANIDMISGATYTSTGYIDSLQNALSKAGLT